MEHHDNDNLLYEPILFGKNNMQSCNYIIDLEDLLVSLKKEVYIFT